jgi:membrane protease YdiL (CAAX protease family)
MTVTRTLDSLRPDTSPRRVGLVFGLTVAIAASEAPLFFGQARYTIWAYAVLLVGLSLAPLVLEAETPVFLVFALLPVFRLVNLTMPVFVELTLLWLPLVYGPFIPVFVYMGWRASVDSPDAIDGLGESEDSDDGEQVSGTGRVGEELPWWLGGNRGGKLRALLARLREFLAAPEEALSSQQRVLYWTKRVVVVALLPVVAVGFLASMVLLAGLFAEVEYSIIPAQALIESLDRSEVWLLAVVMVGFVGFVEEVLFRGLLQQVLERRLGFVLGLVVASAIYGLMHSVYGQPVEILLAAGVGLVFGLVYDVTESLVLVSAVHGLQNVFLFGLIPLGGPSAVALLRGGADRILRHSGALWTGHLPVTDFCVCVVSL